jgi:hypothetical protein
VIEWAEVAPGWALVATADRAWRHRLLPGDPFTDPMVGPGTPETTGALLDAAVGIFQHRRLRTPAPPLTVDAYVERVLASYHGGHATPRVMRKAARRFAVGGRGDLAAWALAVAEDEDHDHLALADLAELGYPPDVAVTMPCPQPMRAAIEYFEACVDGDAPMSCLGYAYALERPAALLDRSYVDAVRRVLPPSVDATRCLRWHSSLGEEPDHIDALLGVIAALPAADRTAVVRAAYETARILFAPPLAA